MLGELDISRGQISTAYLVGTLTGALAMPSVGRAIDRYGVRRSMAVIGALFGAALMALSAVQGLVGLTIGFVGIRLLGQGALGLAATTAAARWFVHRRGAVLGVVSAAGAAGISIAPLALERLVTTQGWRTAWLVEGLVIWAVVIPLAAFAMRDRPAQLGQRPDGAPPSDDPGDDHDEHEEGATRREAFATPFFWVLAAGVATSGMLSTAVGFHQISLLGERGLSTAEAAANFMPQTIAGLLATLATGYLVDNTNARALTAASMAMLAAGLLWGTVVDPGWSAVGFGITIGAGSAAIRALEAAAIPKYFGTRHLGSIRGFMASVGVGSTAFGPVLFAVMFESTGSYTEVLLASAVLPALVAVAAALTPTPRVQHHPRPGPDQQDTTVSRR